MGQAWGWSKGSVDEGVEGGGGSGVGGGGEA